MRGGTGVRYKLPSKQKKQVQKALTPIAKAEAEDPKINVDDPVDAVVAKVVAKKVLLKKKQVAFALGPLHRVKKKKKTVNLPPQPPSPSPAPAPPVELPANPLL